MSCNSRGKVVAAWPCLSPSRRPATCAPPTHGVEAGAGGEAGIWGSGEGDKDQERGSLIEVEAFAVVVLMRLEMMMERRGAREAERLGPDPDDIYRALQGIWTEIQGSRQGFRRYLQGPLARFYAIRLSYTVALAAPTRTLGTVAGDARPRLVHQSWSVIGAAGSDWQTMVIRSLLSVFVTFVLLSGYAVVPTPTLTRSSGNDHAECCWAGSRPVL